MRDAFGGAFLIKVMLIFLGIYVAFMAVALNYAKAFKVKNYIINVIEQYEGVSEEAYNTINNYINGIGYNPALDPQDLSGQECLNGQYNRAYCIKQMYSDANRGTYYMVTTYMKFELPFFNFNISIPISGETRLVTNN